MVCLFRTHPGSFESSHNGQYTTLRSHIRAVLSAGVLSVVRAHVAQSVEHLHGKEKVIGSIPIVGSTCTLVSNERAAVAAEKFGQALNPGSS